MVWNRDLNTNNGDAMLGVRAERTIDQGLRSHMVKVYNYMAAGLGITGLVAYLVSTNAAIMHAINDTPLKFVIFFAPLAFVLVFGFGLRRMSVQALQTTFWVLAATMGLSLSSLFLVYTGESITRTFFITAATFGAMSLWGYTTRRDLTGMGSFLMMGVWGLIIAMFVSVFINTTGLQLAISVIGVLIFTGLTAYDTQKIKSLYSESWGVEANSKLAIMGAVSLYFDFVNLFLFMLRFTGGGRRD